jgi:hypothetical protein
MGLNEAGELGDGTTTTCVTPVQVASDVASVAAGAEHSLVVKIDGTLWAMGWNDYGQLGDGTTTNRATPVPVASGPAIAPVTFSPNGGIHAGPVTVTLACATAGTTIRYTTNGANVTESSPTYTAPFLLTTSATVKARAYKQGSFLFAQTTATYTMPPGESSGGSNGGGGGGGAPTPASLVLLAALFLLRRFVARVK